MRRRFSSSVSRSFALAWSIAVVALACTASPTPVPTATTPPATPTTVPTSTATPVPPTVTPRGPESCEPAEASTLQNVTSTSAAPYLIHHPASAGPSVPIVIFLPGGRGSQRSAERVWSRYLSGAAEVEAFRAVVPYSVEIEFADEVRRTYKILDEVLACYGGDPAKVHIAGVSYGGEAAFRLALGRPESFATLLGAPGGFPKWDPPAWAEAFKSLAVFNGVGSEDGWKPDVKATHDALVAGGVESVYVEFAGEGHGVSDAFDESVFFEFWLSHSSGDDSPER